MAYFYSDKYDTWIQFDDDHIKPVGNFKSIIKKCVAGRQQPTILFYEYADIIINIINTQDKVEGQKEKKLYFSDKGMKKNNFWMNETKVDSGCSMF